MIIGPAVDTRRAGLNRFGAWAGGWTLTWCDPETRKPVLMLDDGVGMVWRWPRR